MTPISNDLAAPGPHERKIREIFLENFVWRGNPPLFSKPLYIMAFTNRCGSNLLADYLRQTKCFRGFGEGLNWDIVQDSLQRYPVRSFPEYVAHLADADNTPGAWGIKASWDQILMLHRANIPAMFSGVQIIHPIRQDLLGQAISHWIAHQTNQWTSVQKGLDVVPEFACDRIEQILMGIVRSNTYIDLISRALEISRHVVVYERLQENAAEAMGELLGALSIGLEGWEPRSPRIARQRNETNDHFQRQAMERWRAAIMP